MSLADPSYRVRPKGTRSHRRAAITKIIKPRPAVEELDFTGRENLRVPAQDQTQQGRSTARSRDDEHELRVAHGGRRA